MALDTPTIAEINATIISQIEAEISQTIPLLPKAFTRVLAKTLAGVYIVLYKYAGWMALQQFVSRAALAETEINGNTISPLTEWGRLIGEGDPVAAESAQESVRVKFSSSLGSTLSSGTKMTFLSTGVTYATTADVTITADFNVTVEAIQDQAGNNGLGAIGNLAISDELEWIITPAGADSSWKPTVTAHVRTGADAEEEEDYRRRVINKFQRRPQGGAYSDYFEWGGDAAGIVNIYPYTADPGEINIYAEASVESSGSADGIPTAAQLQAVYDQIQLDVDGLATRRPVSAFINFTGADPNQAVYPITRTAIDVNISNLQGIAAGDVATVKAEIDAAITEKMLTYEPYIVGLTIDPRNTVTRADIAGVAFQVAWANGGTIDSVTIARSGSPVAESISVTEGEKFKAGTIAYL